MQQVIHIHMFLMKHVTNECNFWYSISMLVAKRTVQGKILQMDIMLVMALDDFQHLIVRYFTSKVSDEFLQPFLVDVSEPSCTTRLTCRAPTWSCGNCSWLMRRCTSARSRSSRSARAARWSSSSTSPRSVSTPTPTMLTS